MEEGLKDIGHIWASYAEPCVFDCGTGYSAKALREECDKRNEDWLDEPKYERESK